MGSYTKIRDSKARARFRRRTAIRKRISGTAARPRLSVFRSLKYIYVQAIDDLTGQVLAAASDSGKNAPSGIDGVKKAARAKLVGVAIGEALKGKNISEVIFDRNGFIYHGRVKAVAEGAREAGLKF